MPYKDKEKQKEFQRQWCAKRKKDWIEKNGPCKCGSTKNLEVDHIDPSKKWKHSVWSYSKEKREDELKKCQVLCEKCHMRKTLEQRKKTTHGKLAMYTNHGCRCSLCKNAKIESSRKYYK